MSGGGVHFSYVMHGPECGGGLAGERGQVRGRYDEWQAGAAPKKCKLTAFDGFCLREPVKTVVHGMWAVFSGYRFVVVP